LKRHDAKRQREEWHYRIFQVKAVKVYEVPQEKVSQVELGHRMVRIGDDIKDEKNYHFPKNRCVKVAMKLISMSNPTTASNAAIITNGLCNEFSLPRPGKKPRP